MNGDSKFADWSVELKELSRRGYTLLRKIGQGAYASVYLALHGNKETNEKVVLACKIFKTDHLPVQCYSKFFPRELEILKLVTHPNIVKLYSIMQRYNRIFIFMNYETKGDLLAYIKKNGPIPESQAKIWLKQLANAVEYLHGKNIAHRDLKCENILISSDRNVKIADFGFGRFCVDDNNRRVLSRTFCGSAAYVAPEIISGVPYNPKLADIWSLGVVLFIMLNANMPFDDSNLQKLLQLQIMKKFSFRKIAKLSHNARSLIKRMLEADMTKRLRLSRLHRHPWLDGITGTTSLNEFTTIRGYIKHRSKLN